MAFVIVRSVGEGTAAKAYLRAVQCDASGGIVAVAYGGAPDARVFHREGAARLVLQQLLEQPVLAHDQPRLASLAAESGGMCRKS